MDKTVYTIDIKKLKDFEGTQRDFVYILYNEKKLNARKKGASNVSVDVFDDDGVQKGRLKKVLKKYGADAEYIKEVFNKDKDAKTKKKIKENYNNDMGKQTTLYESAKDVAANLVFKYGAKTRISEKDIVETFADAIDDVFRGEFQDIDPKEIDWADFYDKVDSEIESESEKGLRLESIGVENADDLAYLVYILADEDEGILLDVDNALLDCDYEFASGDKYSELDADSIPDGVDFYQGWDEQDAVDDDDDSELPPFVDEGFCYVKTEEMINECKKEAREELLNELRRDGKLNEGVRELPKPVKPARGANPTRAEYRSYINDNKKLVKEDVAEIKAIVGKKCSCVADLNDYIKMLDSKRIQEKVKACVAECKELSKSEIRRVCVVLDHICKLLDEIGNINAILSAAKSAKANESVTSRFANSEWRKIFEAEEDGKNDEGDDDSDKDAKDPEDKSGDDADNKDDADNDSEKGGDSEDADVIDGDKVKVTFSVAEGHERDEAIEKIKKDLDAAGIPEDGIEIMDAEDDDTDIQVVVNGDYISELKSFCDDKGVDLEEKLGGEIEIDGDDDGDGKGEDDKDGDKNDDGSDDTSSDSADDIFGGAMLDDIFGASDDEPEDGKK